MDRADRIRRSLSLAMAEKDMTAADLARAIGRQADYIRDFLNGKKVTLGAAELPKIESVLGMPNGLLVAGFSDVRTEFLQSGNRTEVNIRPAPNFISERDLPVYSAAEGGPGEMVVDTDPIEIVPRPWFLKDVKEGYGVLIVGESMEPVFEPGDIAIVNPKSPLIRNKDAIFIAEDRGQGTFKASIKRLTRWSAHDWYVRQFNPPEGQASELVLPKQIWSKALRVVGKYYG